MAETHFSGTLIVGGSTIGAGSGSAIVSLTHAVGTGDDSVADVGATFVQATLNNNFRDITDKIEEILVALRTAGIIAT